MKASCLCNIVQLRFTRTVGDFVYCHCRSCRKSSGSAFGANVSVPTAELIVETGQDNIGTYESSPGKVRHFCKTCASPLYTKVGESPEYLRVRLGALDTDFSQQPSAHIFMDHKAAWDESEQSMPRYAEWPDLEVVALAGSRQPSVDKES